MLAAPARERVGFIIADVADRGDESTGLIRKRHDLPFAVNPAPMAGRLPLLAIDSCEAIHQPERRRGVAAVGHEGEPLGIGDEVARQLHRTDEGAVRGLLIVEMEGLAGMSDRVDALAQRNPFIA